MTAILSTIPTVKDNPLPPMRVRWLSAKARISRHHAGAVAALLFQGGPANG